MSNPNKDIFEAAISFFVAMTHAAFILAGILAFIVIVALIAGIVGLISSFV